MAKIFCGFKYLFKKILKENLEKTLSFKKQGKQSNVSWKYFFTKFKFSEAA